MDMAWITWNLLLSIGFFVSPAVTVGEQSGIRRFYVLQPGPSGTDRVHVSSISSRTGSVGQPRSYNVELRTSYGGQVRNRRMGSQATPSLPLRQDTQFTQQQKQQIRHTSHQIKISGVNVCGGQCCQGWSKAPGSQRCTKPNCLPQCQNGGMCLKPQHCVCKPGSIGKACEHKTTPSHTPAVPGKGQPSVHAKGQPKGQPNGAPQRPIPQHSPPQYLPPAPAPGLTLTVKQQPHVARPQHVPQHVRSPLSMTVHQGSSQQFVMKPKYYQTHTQVHTSGHPYHRPIPISVGHGPLQVGNHTGRIKVVFTPTICKVTCSGRKCQNSCEKGNTTTIISENGHATDTLTAPNFRVVVCHLPCMNGGKCSSRDRCQCPPNFTGKFCQVSLPNGARQQQAQQQVSHWNGQSSQVHSTHTIPLTYGGGQSQVKFGPNIVNIHVKHPPEASVQIHQVSPLDAAAQKPNGAQAGHYTYHSESSQKGQQSQTVYPNTQTFVQHYPVSSKAQLGRCFQETSGTQCGKALPGLSKQEDCCGSVGTSWGFHKCQKCPKKPSIPLSGSRFTMDCPQGYKRVNNSYCQDINECQLQGVCPNGMCMNAMGSYRCTCKPGYIPDPTLSTCIPDTAAVREEKGACFRFVGSGKQCLHPVSVQLSKQLCCCSVGKAWGPHCDKCPSPGTAAFKEICPGGMGYTVTGTYRPKPVIRSDSGSNNPRIPHQEPQVPPLPLPTVQNPVEALSITERQLPAVPVVTAAPEEELVTFGVNNNSVVEPGQPQLSPGVSTMRMEPAFPEVVEKTSPPAPVAILPSSASQDIAPTQLAEVDECLVSPFICGPGVCINSADGYTCICNIGYQLDAERNTCVDVDECGQSPLLCANGHCRNTEGSFRCVCQPGFVPDEEGTSCIDVNECLDPGVCGDDGFCENTMGSYTCRHCEAGFKMSRTGHCEDVNECLDHTICATGMCTNTHGSYQCEACPEGFEGKGGQCVDVDECLDASACANGKCSNFEGSFVCACHDGYQLSPDGKSCTDVDECWNERICSRGRCQNTEGSFICSCGQGFQVSLAGDQCDDVDECQELAEPCGSVGQCVNNMGSYYCSCPQGYLLLNGTSCQDADECLDDPELCGPHGTCVNTGGSFYCDCQRGFSANQDTLTCEDVDECAVNGTVCGPHGFCENAVGSFRCLCDRGFQESPDGLGCVDVNECELLSSLCGEEALCDNVEGTFLCVCPKENQEYNQMTAKCTPSLAEPSVERKECYYNLNDENLCENVLTSSVTMEECCCTLGAGWGDNCEVHPCPVLGTDQFAQMCPAGKGNVPTGDSAFGMEASSFKDADECALFSQEICKDGFCLNTPGSYECYCKQGLYYDEVKLRCLDIDECLDESTCGGGQCINSHGSYMCFCTPPMMLNPDSMRCETAPTVSEPAEQIDIYQDICWQRVTQESLTCTNPLAGRKTTYTECCCLYGEAWGMDCALCPNKDSESYATMCNMPHREGRRPYGRDALAPPSEHDYPIHEALEYDSESETPRFVPNYESEEHPYDTFEGLRADECGILNGCENGRCVRVQEGYTCDCFDGYTLDMSRMACVDVNECSELNNGMSLCKNGKCINTQGSYKCICLPGFVESEKPNYCVPEKQEAAVKE